MLFALFPMQSNSNVSWFRYELDEINATDNVVEKYVLTKKLYDKMHCVMEELLDIWK